MNRRFNYKACVFAVAAALGASGVYAHELGGDRDDYYARAPVSQDGALDNSVRDALRRAPDLDASRITVDVDDGVAYLRGTVATDEQRRMAHEIAHTVPGIRDVMVGDLEVAAAPYAEPGYGSQDESLHEQVHEALEHTRGIDTSRLHISVRNGVVYLDGSVPNSSQKIYAHDVAHSVPGVREVNARDLRVSG